MFSLDGHVRKQRVVLEQHADVAAMHRHAGDATARSAKMSPDVGATSPAIMRRHVVLPQPLGPSSATMLPGSIVSDTSVDRDRSR